MISSENRFPLFGIMAIVFLSMISSENRFPLFGIMLYRTTPEMQHGLRRGGLIWLLRKQRGAAPP